MEKIIDKIRIISNSIRRALDNNNKAVGLTGSKRYIIQHLGELGAEETVYEKDIGSRFNLGRSGVSELLRSMEKDGLIKRVQSAADGRYKIVTLSDKGRKLYRSGVDKLAALEADVTACLQQSERTQLARLLDQIIANMR